MEPAGGRNPESYTWPLLAVLFVILPQALVPAGDRVGPPLLVPVIESAALLMLVGIAARPGPVPRSARSVVLTLFCVLALANAAAATRLVTLVLDGHPVDGVRLTVGRILVAAALVLLTNVVTFGLLSWQVDGGGPARRVAEPAPFPDFQFPQTLTEGLAAPGWRPHFGGSRRSMRHRRRRLLHRPADRRRPIRPLRSPPGLGRRTCRHHSAAMP
jgi:hypothetical protein